MKILFGVFDWGLGHATRDKPLIEALLKEKNEVHIISTGRPLKVLEEHFKDKCIYHNVPSLHQLYTQSKFFKLAFTLSIFKLLKSLKQSRAITKRIIEKERFDLVISDCRYDVYDKINNSYLINHQLRFKAPTGSERFIEKWLAKQMANYKFVLVPDFPTNNLTGMLSHDLYYFPKNKIKYIGILSHIRKKSLKKDINYFISLSGPDYTRTQLEKKIISQISTLKGKIVIAGGNPDIEKRKSEKNIEFHSFLNSKQQEKMMNRAKFVIIRAGYTTIMELAELDIKKALLIPSPGQTEQEYIGKYLQKKGFFHYVDQKDLNLEKDILEAMKFNGFKAPWKTKESVKKFLEKMKNEK